MRKVICAAIRNAEGAVLLGIRHYSTDMVQQIKQRNDGDSFCHRSGADQGFVDQNCVYMDRREAYKVALEAGQIKEKAIPILYSEDLYSGYQKCWRCKKILLLECFNKNKANKNGLDSSCKECSKELNRAKYQAHREKILARQKAYNEVHKEEIRARKRAYYPTCKERFLKQQKEYREVNGSAIRERMRIQRSNLVDRYIARLLKVQLGLNEVPKEMIDAKRDLIIVRKVLKKDSHDK